MPSRRLGLVGVGPQRTGTSWLHEALREHPGLCFPADVKETHFLDARYDRGWDWYWSHFPRARPGARLAEICATYFEAPPAAARLHAHAPDCRVIVTLRDPAARTFSLYLHERRKGRIRTDFASALAEQPRLLDGSRYARHLPRWRERFGDGVLILLLDDVARAPEEALERVRRFAGLAWAPVPAAARAPVNRAALPAHPRLGWLAARTAARLRDRRLHRGVEVLKRLGLRRLLDGAPALPALDPDLRARLVAEFTPDIEYLERLLGRPLAPWRSVA